MITINKAGRSRSPILADFLLSIRIATANTAQLVQVTCRVCTISPPHYFPTSASSNYRFGHLRLHRHLNNSEENLKATWKILILSVGIEPRSKRLRSSKLRLIELSYQGSPWYCWVFSICRFPFDSLFPSLLSGKTHWEWYSAKIFLLQTDFSLQTISKEVFKSGLREILVALNKLQNCLKLSQEGTFEAKILEYSHKAIGSINDTLTFLDMKLWYWQDMSVCLFVWIYVCLYEFMSVCMYLCMYLCLSVCLYVCMSVNFWHFYL